MSLQLEVVITLHSTILKTTIIQTSREKKEFKMKKEMHLVLTI